MSIDKGVRWGWTNLSKMSWFDMWSNPSQNSGPMVLHYAYRYILTYALKDILKSS